MSGRSLRPQPPPRVPCIRPSVQGCGGITNTYVSLVAHVHRVSKIRTAKSPCRSDNIMGWGRIWMPGTNLGGEDHMGVYTSSPRKLLIRYLPIYLIEDSEQLCLDHIQKKILALGPWCVSYPTPSMVLYLYSAS